MVFEKALCRRCFNRKYRGRPWATYQKDLEKDEAVCDDCGAPAEVLVKINGEGEPGVTDQISQFWTNLLDITTFSKRRKILAGICFTARSGDKGIELYLDEVAKFAVEVAKEVPWLDFFDIFLKALDASIRHEIFHFYGAEEEFIRKAEEWLLEINREEALVTQAMVWELIKCPKEEKDVTWNECLSCNDEEKDSRCPLRVIRQGAQPRGYEIGRYHVTELANIRHAYFERTEKHTAGWDEYADLFQGTAAHRHIQAQYGRSETEIYVWKKYLDKGFEIVGSIDIIDGKLALLWELKTYLTLRYLLDRDEPEADHAFQGQSYAILARSSKPWLKVRKIKVHYMAKIKGGERWKDFEVPMADVEPEMIQRASELHEALLLKKPPKRRCANWLCNFCHYTRKCKEYD